MSLTIEVNLEPFSSWYKYCFIKLDWRTNNFLVDFELNCFTRAQIKISILHFYPQNSIKFDPSHLKLTLTRGQPFGGAGDVE